jgi:hypothetical protein
MIKLTPQNTAKAIERCKQLKPKVHFLADRTFSVKSANNTNSYTVRFEVQDGEKFGLCECKASERGLVCYHIIAGATANIYRQGLKLQTVKTRKAFLNRKARKALLYP